MRSLTVLTCVFLAACASEKEVAFITERPISTEEAPRPQPAPQAEPSYAGSVEAGRFDGGKMWTFDNPPLEYFEMAYGMHPDTTWFNKARLGALRFSTSCSASFVSPRALVMTNHHCARESIADVSGVGEHLLESGFYAEAPADERKVKDLYVEQLLAIEDVTARVQSASRAVRGDNEKTQARRIKAGNIERDMTEEAEKSDSTLRVQVIELYNGGRYAAYTFRRYEDVRLVMAPEKKLGFFGGDTDNFTYPRYALDLSFFRVYDADGRPLETEHYFQWSASGSQPGDPVFVVGNPGSTSRLGTVAALEYERDYAVPLQIAALEGRAASLRAYLSAEPEDDADLRNQYFSLSNTLKSLSGQQAGLRDNSLMARRAAAERHLRADILASDSLARIFGGLFQDLAELQRSKRAEFERASAFAFFGTTAGSHVLTRALYGYYYATLKRRGFSSAEELADVRKEALQIHDFPREVETALVAIRLEEVRKSLGESDPTFRKITGGLPVDSVAAQLVSATALVDSAGFATLLDHGFLSSGDATVAFISALAPLYFTAQGQAQSFGNRQDLLNGQLAQARFALYGMAAPPDASSSLRIADGVVRGYASGGATAPAFTTFYGLYDHYNSYRHVSEEWDLPERWLAPPPSFDLATPLNLVSTNDIAGGNSGSPLLNRDLEIVGLIFDGNMESLPNTYLYTDRAARAISVDSRGILAALRHIYGADRIFQEIAPE